MAHPQNIVYVCVCLLFTIPPSLQLVDIIHNTVMTLEVTYSKVTHLLQVTFAHSEVGFVLGVWLLS